MRIAVVIVTATVLALVLATWGPTTASDLATDTTTSSTSIDEAEPEPNDTPEQTSADPQPPPETPPSEDPPPPPQPAVEGSPCSTQDWSVERQISSLVFASLTNGSRAELDTAIAADVGGVFISTAAVPLVTSGQVRVVTNSLERPPLIAVDEEGGRVQRLRGHLWAIPSAREMGRTLNEGEIRSLAERHGRAMRELGVTMNFAPVVDVTDAPDETVIGDRSFSANAGEVTAHAGAFAEGLTAAGVLPTLKHFPGHGRASGDSHFELVTTPPLPELSADLEPYRELLGRLPDVAVMTGHLRVPGVDGGEPATTSPALIGGLLREELGFDGLVVTDDLGGMVGIRGLYSVPQAAVLAVIAGVDMVLVPVEQINGVASALDAAVQDGRLSGDQLTTSADRVLRARSGSGCS